MYLNVLVCMCLYARHSREVKARLRKSSSGAGRRGFDPRGVPPAWRCSPLSHSGQRPKDVCFKLGGCDRQGAPGLGSPLFYINTWAMVWPKYYPASAPWTWKVGVIKTDPVWTCFTWPAWVLPSMQIQLYLLETALLQEILLDSCKILPDSQCMSFCACYFLNIMHNTDAYL